MVTCYHCLNIHRRAERKPWTYRGKPTGLFACPKCEHTTELGK